MIEHQTGSHELRWPPSYQATIVPPEEVHGRSRLLDQTYTHVPEYGYTMTDEREQLQATAVAIVNKLSPEFRQSVETDLLSPELITAVPDDIDLTQQRAIHQALGDSCRTLATSQRLHRGFFRLTPLVSQALMRQLAVSPNSIVQLFKEYDRKAIAPFDNSHARHIAGATTVSQLFARLESAPDEPQNTDEAARNQALPRDANDARTFRYAARTDQIVNPSYLFHPVYEQTAVPFNEPQEVYGMLRHMVIGFRQTCGNDHMFLYANPATRPNSVASARADFSVCRPGNYLFHDLQSLYEQVRKTVAGGSDWIKDMPFELILDYAVSNYMQGMEVDTRRIVEHDPKRTAYGGPAVTGYFGGQAVSFPLRRVDRVIPKRQQRKANGNVKAWTKEDYLNELVDIARKLDDILAESGRDQQLPKSMRDYLVESVACTDVNASMLVRQTIARADGDNIPPLTTTYTLYD